jgi:carbamoyltransferase
MKVLGISPLDKDATAALVEDGRVLFAAGEERFSRVKLQSGFPARAIEAALRATGTRLEEIDAVAYPFLTWQQETELFENGLESESEFMTDFAEKPDLMARLARAEERVPARTTPIPGLAHPNERMEKGTLKTAFYRLAGGETLVSRNVARAASRTWGKETTQFHRAWQEELERGLTELGLLGKLRRGEHHMAHSAAAYLASGFERALVVTLDGYGSGLAGSIALGEGGRIRRLHAIEYPHSLGTFYEQVTSSLGFKPSRHEGKIVGLAAHGDPEVLLDVLLSRFEQTPGSYRILESNNIYFSRHLATRFPKVDVAAAYQRCLEIVATGVVRHWVEQTGASSVVLAGGVASNVKMNQRIYEVEGVERIFVYPNMGDGGAGTGLALLLSWPGGVSEPLRDVYFGPEFSEDEMLAELRASSLEFEVPANLAAHVARRIDEGDVVARFDGRMEYGPRALGNRSVLYHARKPEVNQWLNQRLGRTEFMPFAPVTLWEARERCYRSVRGAELAAQFMTVTLDCTDFMRRNCPAAVHVDGTARPQLVRREVNPGYYDIIAEYEKLSGIPTLINTSFNMHEEPIVCSPRDAIRCFLQGNLDGLALGKFYVPNPARRRGLPLTG